MTTEQFLDVATYERVSSEDQRDRETIKTQRDVLVSRLRSEPSRRVVMRYTDDGISGTIPLNERPGGKKLLEDAAKGLFKEVWVSGLDRLGRDVVDSIIAKQQLNAMGVVVRSATENVTTDFEFDLRAVLAAEERRTFLARSKAGMIRAAKEGRYFGGVVPYGYLVNGRKGEAKLVPSDLVVWGDWTEADVIRHIYDRLARDLWSCVKIADELNTLGVPTSYTKDNRMVRVGLRKQKTRGVWRSGRIRNLVVNPTYRGEQQYGRRSSTEREVVSAEVPALVSEDVWFSALETLSQNRIAAGNAHRAYLLKSVIKCVVCGLKYSGGWDKRTETVRYRCNGKQHERGLIEGKCQSKSLKGSDLEPVVWSDIEALLRNPGNIVEELAMERDMNPQAALAEAERVTLEAALRQTAAERSNAIRLATKSTISDHELSELTSEIAERREAIEARLSALSVPIEEEAEPVDGDVLAQVRRRLDQGLSDVERQEIVQLLVNRITIYSEGEETGKKQATAVVEYRFPKSVVATFTGRGSSRRPK